jgi:hypothetical protein
VLAKLQEAARLFNFNFNNAKMQSNLDITGDSVTWIGKNINITTL